MFDICRGIGIVGMGLSGKRVYPQFPDRLNISVGFVLVGGLEHFLFSYILGIILTID